MKRLLVHAFFSAALALSFTCTTLTMEHKPQVFTVDHDDVINIKNKLSVTDYAKYMLVIGKIAWNNPRGAAGLVWNWRAIKNRGMQAAQTTEGTSNIIYTLAQELKAEGYADLTPYVEEMTAITVKPTPIWSTINYLKELKAQGYTIIGATNQDYYQNKYFRERMEAQGVKFEEFFDAVMVAHTKLKAPEVTEPSELIQLLDKDKNIFMPTSPNGTKPQAEYYTALKAVARIYNPRAHTFIHTDDKLENITGADHVAEFKAAHFKLADNKSARRCTPTELDSTFAEWKSVIQQHI